MPSEAEKFLLRLRENDTPMGISRETLRKLASTLGVDETTAVHVALAELREKVLPRYDRDDGPLTAAQLRDARSLIAQDREPTSSLFGTTARQRRKATA